MNSHYASGKYRFEIRMSEEVPEGRKEVAQIHRWAQNTVSFKVLEGRHNNEV